MTDGRSLFLNTFLLVIVSTASCQSMRADPISREQYDQLRQALTPDTTELWRSVPWSISLLEAQNNAAQQQKPLFIWAMDGHPLGCT